jgi:anaerobic C4-dicarboxylate transporter
MYYLSTFYKRKELATRIAIFLCFNCIAGMISGPIGYASTFLEGHWGMHGWQFLFLIEGIPTTLLSVFCFCFLVRDVQHAKWLTPAQKDLQMQRIAQEQTSNGHDHVLSWKQFKSCITDWRAWLMGMLFMCTATQMAGISLFLPTLLQG